MDYSEFSNQFDVLYNNITSNQAPGLTEYEKSVFLTKAQNEIVKNYFTAESKGNNIGQGFDDSAKRQADFSCLMQTKACTPGAGADGVYSQYSYTTSGSASPVIISSLSFTLDDSPYAVPAGIYTIDTNTITVDEDTVAVQGLPNDAATLYVAQKTSSVEKIDPRSFLFTFPNDVFIAINEAITTKLGTRLQVVPLRYDEYLRLMSKPYQRPLKHQAWRLINSGLVSGSTSDKYVEIIPGPHDEIVTYVIRYIRFPKPIIVGPLENLTINGYVFTGDTDGIQTSGCELDPIIHEDILQRAVELAKVSWTSNGQDNMQAVIQAGQRSE